MQGKGGDRLAPNRLHRQEDEMATRIEEVAIKEIKIVGQRRSLQDDKVRIIADSMSKIGLKTPITVRQCKAGKVLVAGLHRLEAAKLLGWKKIAAVQQSE